MHKRSFSFSQLFRSRWLFVLNTLVLFFLVFTFGREYLANRAVNREIERLQSEKQELQAQSLHLKELETALQTQSAIEREARLKLGLAKPGESIVVIQETPQTETTTLGTSDPNDPLGLVIDSNETQKLANPIKWWYYFFSTSTFESLKSL